MSHAGPVGPLAGIAGVLGTLVCVGAMVLAVVGVAGVGASASMAGMAAGAQGTAPAASSSGTGLLGFLLRAGPAMLVVSIGAVALSFAIRRRAAAVPALVGGAIVYWGMYAQSSLFVMGAAIVIGLLVWAAAYLWAHSLRVARRDTPRIST